MSMERIVVISDTHGNMNVLKNIIDRYKDTAVAFIHLGDGFLEVSRIRTRYPDLPLYTVKGNNDFCCSPQDFPILRELTVADKKIIFTHGHHYDVNWGEDKLANVARRNNAHIALYGHTHTGGYNYVDDILVLNPGSPSLPRNSVASFATIDIGDFGIVPNIIDYNKAF